LVPIQTYSTLLLCAVSSPGVAYRRAGGLFSSSDLRKVAEQTVTAKREVIVSCGALGTPHLLLLSGKPALRQLKLLNCNGGRVIALESFRSLAAFSS
jgi:hypothetical protein